MLAKVQHVSGFSTISRRSQVAPGERRWRSPARAPVVNVVLVGEHDAANAANLKKKSARVFPFCPVCASTTVLPLRPTWPLRPAQRRSCWSCPPRRCAAPLRRWRWCACRAHAGRGLRQRHRKRGGSKQFRHRHRRRLGAPRAEPAILSGPSFAADVARGLPTAVTLAARDDALAAELARAIGSASFRPDYSTGRARRRDRRRGQERARHRGRCGARNRPPGASAARGADHARLRGARPFRPRLRRQGRDHERPVRPRRSVAHLFEHAIAQFLVRRSAGRGQRPAEIHGGLAEGVFTAPVLLDMGASAASTCRSRPRSRRSWTKR